MTAYSITYSSDSTNARGISSVKYRAGDGTLKEHDINSTRWGVGLATACALLPTLTPLGLAIGVGIGAMLPLLVVGGSTAAIVGGGMGAVAGAATGFMAQIMATPTIVLAGAAVMGLVGTVVGAGLASKGVTDNMALAQFDPDAPQTFREKLAEYRHRAAAVFTEEGLSSEWERKSGGVKPG